MAWMGYIGEDMRDNPVLQGSTITNSDNERSGCVVFSVFKRVTIASVVRPLPTSRNKETNCKGADRAGTRAEGTLAPSARPAIKETMIEAESEALERCICFPGNSPFRIMWKAAYFQGRFAGQRGVASFPRFR